MLPQFPYYKVYFKPVMIVTDAIDIPKFPYYKVYFKHYLFWISGTIFIYFHTIKSILN